MKDGKSGDGFRQTLIVLSESMVRFNNEKIIDSIRRRPMDDGGSKAGVKPQKENKRQKRSKRPF